jgi:acyl-CoA thioesterase FadM
MNLLFRLLRMLLFSGRQTTLDYFSKCTTRFRVWPTDLDVLGHMNNGKYFSIMDLARVNLMIRSGLAKQMREHGIYPIISAETIHFRKSLKVFRWFDVQTQFFGWDDKHVWLEQIFMRNDEIYARALVKGRMLHKSGKKMTMPECIETLGIKIPSPPLPDYILQWKPTSEI